MTHSWVHDCDPFGESEEGGYNNLGVKWVMGQVGQVGHMGQ